MASKHLTKGKATGSKKVPTKIVKRASTLTTPTKITFFHPRQDREDFKSFNRQDRIRFDRLEEQLGESRTNTEQTTCNRHGGESIKFGRSPEECQAVLDDENMSSVYGELKVEEEKELNELRVFMYNLSTVKSIKVDERNVNPRSHGRLDRAVLRDGSTVEFDPTKLKFRFEVKIEEVDIGDSNFEFKTGIYQQEPIQETQAMGH